MAGPPRHTPASHLSGNGQLQGTIDCSTETVLSHEALRWQVVPVSGVNKQAVGSTQLSAVQLLPADAHEAFSKATKSQCFTIVANSGDTSAGEIRALVIDS